MASNGGDASSPPTEATKMEPTANKLEPTPAGDSKPEQNSNEVKQVAEDLSADKTSKGGENPSPQAPAPNVENKTALANDHGAAPSSTSNDTETARESVPEAKSAKEPVPETKPENGTNGTENQKPEPSIPPTSQTSTESTPAKAEDSKPSTENNTPVAKTVDSSASENTKAEKKEDLTAQKFEEASKPAEVKASPLESNPVPAETSQPVAQPPKSKTTTAASALAASKPASQQVKAVPPVATVAPMPKVAAASSKNNNGSKASPATKHSSGSRADGDAPPEKKAKTSASSAKSGAGNSNTSIAPAGGKTPQQILEYMNKTFEHRRRIITKEMPTIPELQQRYPDLFMHKQLLTEFQRITKIDIDQKIQEFCVRFATAVIEMARGKKGAAPVIARWEKAQQENQSLKQYWDMMTALCLLPLHFGENFSDMVQEIGEDEEVVAQGKIVPVLVARGNVYRTDEFFLIAENTIVQEFEEFTIALASLYSSYWVFNMVYPESIENTYNYIQRCIVRQKEPGSIPTVCRNFTKALQKWNREKEGK